jgi:hypothetical protein
MIAQRMVERLDWDSQKRFCAGLGGRFKDYPADRGKQNVQLKKIVSQATAGQLKTLLVLASLVAEVDGGQLYSDAPRATHLTRLGSCVGVDLDAIRKELASTGKAKAAAIDRIEKRRIA